VESALSSRAQSLRGNAKCWAQRLERRDSRAIIAGYETAMMDAELCGISHTAFRHQLRSRCGATRDFPDNTPAERGRRSTLPDGELLARSPTTASRSGIGPKRPSTFSVRAECWILMCLRSHRRTHTGPNRNRKHARRCESRGARRVTLNFRRDRPPRTGVGPSIRRRRTFLLEAVRAWCKMGPTE